MITVQQVFDMAIHLMDEQSEQTGETDTVDTKEYRYRTISILNTIIPALYVYSGTYAADGRGRPFSGLLMQDSYKNPDFDQIIPLDDTMSTSLLPLYLAAQLLSGENEDLASWFMARFNVIFTEIKSKIPAEFEPISSPYGIL